MLSQFLNATSPYGNEEISIGDNVKALSVSSLNGKAICVFNSSTMQLNEVAVVDLFNRGNAYRWKSNGFESNIRDAFLKSEETWHITDSFEDILEKTNRILNNRWFDKRVVVNFELSENDLKFIEDSARMLNITLDEFVEEAIKAVIQKEEQNDQNTRLSK